MSKQRKYKRLVNGKSIMKTQWFKGNYMETFNPYWFSPDML